MGMELGHAVLTDTHIRRDLLRSPVNGDRQVRVIVLSKALVTERKAGNVRLIPYPRYIISGLTHASHPDEEYGNDHYQETHTDS
jgi:hypothetical protein